MTSLIPYSLLTSVLVQTTLLFSIGYYDFLVYCDPFSPQTASMRGVNIG